MAKPRSKRQPDGELTSGLWEGFKAQQEGLEQAYGTDGVAEARQRARALLEGGWGAVDWVSPHPTGLGPTGDGCSALGHRQE